MCTAKKGPAMAQPFPYYDVIVMKYACLEVGSYSGVLVTIETFETI